MFCMQQLIYLRNKESYKMEDEFRHLQKQNDKQFVITVPKKMVEAEGWVKGQIIKFKKTDQGILMK